jgi:ankyrin repeat protein
LKASPKNLIKNNTYQLPLPLCNKSKLIYIFCLITVEALGYTRAEVLSFEDRENNTPLHSAVNSGHPEVVSHFVKKIIHCVC